MIRIQADRTKLLIALSPLRWFYKIRLKGEKVRCNVCGNNFKQFRSFGYRKRENALCPHCYSVESDRLLWFYLTNEVLGRKNKNNFLYFNPAPGILEKMKSYPLQIGLQEVDYLNSMYRLPNDNKLPGGKADVILFSHVLEYVKDEELAFDELKRLLRPGGFILLQTIINREMDRTYENPSTSEDQDRLNEYFEPGVQRIYGADFIKHLLKAGFEVEKIDYADQLGSAARDYYQLGDGARELIFKCRKI